MTLYTKHNPDLLEEIVRQELVAALDDSLYSYAGNHLNTRNREAGTYITWKSTHHDLAVTLTRKLLVVRSYGLIALQISPDFHTDRDIVVSLRAALGIK